MSATRACALAALAAAAAYWGTLDNGFTWDDHVHIEAAPFVQDAANARVLLTSRFWTGKAEIEGTGRPLVLATLLSDRALWGAQPAGYHLTNLLIHSACAAALAGLAFLLLGSSEAAALAGLLFALHPVQTEAVCEITFRADLLAALGVLLSLAALRLACARRSWPWAAAAAAAFGLGLLAKESAVVLPALALVCEVLFPTGPAAAKTRKTAAVLIGVVLLAYAAFRVPLGGYGVRAAPASAVPAAPTKEATQLAESPPEWKQAVRDPKVRFLTMSGVFGDYARLTLWPAGLQADRGARTVSRWLDPRPWLGWAALALILAAGWAARSRLPGAALGLCWFLIVLAPVSGIAELPNLVAERYLYLAVAGAALAAAAAAVSLTRRFPRPGLALAGAAALVLAPAAAATRARVPAWKDDASLFGRAPVTDSARLRYNRGLIDQQAGRLDEAEAEYRRALALNPDSVEALVNLAEIARRRGDEAGRQALLRRAVAAAPGSSVAYEALADALQAAGRRDQALAAYKKAVARDSRRSVARRKLALALVGEGRAREALGHEEIAVRLEPGSAAAHYELGRIAQEAGRLHEAAAAFREAARLDPKDGLAWANLGVCLQQSGDPAGALAPLKLAVSLLPNSADARRNLGAALDDLGRLPEAREAYAAAARMDPASAPAWHGYGVVLQKLGDRARAEEAYRLAIKADPRKVESLVNLAELRADAGDHDGAAALMARAQAIRPADPIVAAAAADIARRGAAQRGK